MLIVGIAGKAGVGKDTFASYMTRFTRYALADALKDEVAARYGIPTDFPKTEVVPGTNKTYRTLLQEHGFEARQRDPDHWVQLLLEKTRKDGAILVVVPDIRYPNEAAMCDIVLGLTRPIEEIAESSHESENQDLKVDFVIDNRQAFQECAELIERVAIKSFARGLTSKADFFHGRKSIGEHVRDSE